MKKLIKPVLIFALAALMLLSCAACGSTKTDPGPAATNPPASGSPGGSSPTGGSPGESSGGNTEPAPVDTDYPRTAGGILIDGDPSTGTYTVLSRMNGPVYVQEATPTYTQPKNPGTVSIYTNQLVALDPAVTSDTENGWCLNVYEPLFYKQMQADGSVEFVPLLATDWSFDDEGSFHVTLREGVKFHDGTDMTAEDVLFTIQRILNTKKSPARAGMQGIDMENSYAEDDYHVVIKFKSPVGAFMNYMSSSYLSIMSKDFVESKPDDYDWWDADAGTGAYTIVETVTGISQTYKRFDDYWGEKPEMETIITRRGDTTVMGIDLENGDFDIALQSTYDSVMRVQDGTVTGIDYLLLSSHRAFRLQVAVLPEGRPFSNPDIRQAFSMSLDRELIVLSIYGTEDFGKPSSKQMLEGIDVGVPEYNPEKAREIMSALGYSKDNPCTLNLLTSSTTESAVCLETMQYMAGECYFDVLITNVTSGINSAVSSKDFPCEYDGMLTQAKYTTDAELFYADCDAYQKEVGEFSGLKANDDPEFSRLFNLLPVTTDQEERQKIEDQINILYTEKLYFIPVVTGTQPTLVQNYLQNVVFRDGLGIMWKDLQYKDWVNYGG